MTTRGWIERRVRRAWQTGAGPALRFAATWYGAGADIRNAAYDAGLAGRRRASVPVISVGGLTIGGSGKTPVAAEIGGWLSDAGFRVAMVTHGYNDELAVHRALNPEVPVFGTRDRTSGVQASARAGAEIAVVDSGFQHRRLHRDIEILALDTCSLQHTVRRRLPAGAFRERLSEGQRAGAVILVDRPAAGCDLVALTRELGRVFPAAAIHAVRLVADRCVPANAEAASRSELSPKLAVAGVMWPDLFFREVAVILGRSPERLTLPDHARFDRAVVSRIRRLAGREGVICTLKDAVKLAGVDGPGLDLPFPVWYVAERLEWIPEPPALRASLARACARLCRGELVEPGS